MCTVKINKIINERIVFDRINASGVHLSMARADQVHPLASGNKLYKLQPILDDAKARGFKQILSFGGAFSNHIHALALMGQQQGIETIALIRGEENYPQNYAQNPTLSDAQNAGMRLEFVSRAEYKQRNDETYLKALQTRYPKALIVPEGGSSQRAIEGCAQMAEDINASLSHNASNHILAIASGTGATAAGLVCGLAVDQSLIAYAVLKDASLKSRIDGFISSENKDYQQKQYSIQSADFGGYAKLNKALLDFILDWLDQTSILLDPIYTSKMCLKVVQQIESGEFSAGQSIVLIHSGGLQGWRGMKKRVIALGGEPAWEIIASYV